MSTQLFENFKINDNETLDSLFARFVDIVNPLLVSWEGLNGRSSGYEASLFFEMELIGYKSAQSSKLHKISRRCPLRDSWAI